MAHEPTPADAVVRTQGATQRYGTLTALDDVTFAVRPGEVRALLGKNGAGKSTLIRLLTGVETPVAGEVFVGDRQLTGGGVSEAAELGVACVFQELSLVPAMTVADNYGMGAWPRARGGAIDHARMTAEAQRALDDLGVQIDARAEVGSLSLAEQQMVEIARAMRGTPRVLILDEPTSALAAREVELVLNAVRRIAESGVAVLYVSHRMEEIRQIAQTATVMRDGRLIDTVSVADASTTEIVHLMLGDDAAERTALEDRAGYAGDADAAPLLEVRGLRIAPKVEDVSFAVRAGEVLGIAGLQGSGRTEVLRAIAGFDAVDAGEILVDGQRVARPSARRMLDLGVGMTPENRKRDGIVPELGVDENVVLADYPRERGPVISWGRVRESVGALRDRLQIKTERLGTPIGTLSGGNQQKAVIGRWLHAGSRVLLLDEPTRGVDVESKTQIYALIRQLADEGRAVVFVSSEVEELPLACDRVLVLRGGRIATEHRAPHIDLDRLFADAIAETPTPALAGETA
ncbi:sugar ABC transporter ATP-binding protein [Patulibacter sp. S7RM1-6]